MLSSEATSRTDAGHPQHRMATLGAARTVDVRLAPFIFEVLRRSRRRPLGLRMPVRAHAIVSAPDLQLRAVTLSSRNRRRYTAALPTTRSIGCPAASNDSALGRYLISPRTTYQADDQNQQTGSRTPIRRASA
jgi:hypothetical protein